MAFAVENVCMSRSKYLEINIRTNDEQKNQHDLFQLKYLPRIDDTFLGIPDKRFLSFSITVAFCSKKRSV